MKGKLPSPENTANGETVPEEETELNSEDELQQPRLNESDEEEVSLLFIPRVKNVMNY